MKTSTLRLWHKNNENAEKITKDKEEHSNKIIIIIMTINDKKENYYKNVRIKNYTFCKANRIKIKKFIVHQSFSIGVSNSKREKPRENVCSLFSILQTLGKKKNIRSQ